MSKKETKLDNKRDYSEAIKVMAKVKDIFNKEYKKNDNDKAVTYPKENTTKRNK